MSMAINNEEITKKINLAQKIVNESDIDDSLKIIAFEVVLNFLLGKNNSTQNKTLDSTNNTPSNQIQKSLVNYIKSANLKSHSDKILMMGYYMMVHENCMNFDSVKIKEKYFEIRETKSKNLTVEFNGLIKKGLIMPSQEKGFYMLTQNGIDYVEDKLNNGK